MLIKFRKKITCQISTLSKLLVVELFPNQGVQNIKKHNFIAELFIYDSAFFILCQNIIFNTFFISPVFDYYLVEIIVYLNCCI